MQLTPRESTIRIRQASLTYPKACPAYTTCWLCEVYTNATREQRVLPQAVTSSSTGCNRKVRCLWVGYWSSLINDKLLRMGKTVSQVDGEIDSERGEDKSGPSMVTCTRTRWVSYYRRQQSRSKLSYIRLVCVSHYVLYHQRRSGPSYLLFITSWHNQSNFKMQIKFTLAFVSSLCLISASPTFSVAAPASSKLPTQSWWVTNR